MNVDLLDYSEKLDTFRFFYLSGWGQSYSTRPLRTWENNRHFDQYILQTAETWSLEDAQMFASGLVDDAISDLYDWEQEMIKISNGGDRMYAEFDAWYYYSILDDAGRSLLAGRDGGGLGASLVENKLRDLRKMVDFVRRLDSQGEQRMAQEIRVAIRDFASAIHLSETFLVPVLELNGGYTALRGILATIGIVPAVDVVGSPDDVSFVLST